MPTMQRNPAGGVIDPRNFGRGAGTVRPPMAVPGFQYGGKVYEDEEDIEGQGADDAMLDPMQFVQGALNYGRKKYGIPTDDDGGEQEMGFDDGGVVPTMATEGEEDPGVTGGGNPNAVDPRQAMAYLTGDGAVSAEIAQALEQRVDPNGSLNPTERAMAAIQAAPDDEARFGMLQHYRTKYNAFTGAAKAALSKGDMGGAAQYATMAMDAVPDGKRTQFAPAQGGLAMISKPVGQPKQQSFARGGYVQSFNNGDLVEEEEDEALSHLQPEPQADPPDVAADAPDVTVPEQEPLTGPQDMPVQSGDYVSPEVTTASRPEVVPTSFIEKLLGKGFDDWLKGAPGTGLLPQPPRADVMGLRGGITQPTTPPALRSAATEALYPEALQGQEQRFRPGPQDGAGVIGGITSRLQSWDDYKKGIWGLGGSSAAATEQFGPPEPFGPPAPEAAAPARGPAPAAGAVIDDQRYNPFTGQVRAPAQGAFGSRQEAAQEGTEVPTRQRAPQSQQEGVVPTNREPRRVRDDSPQRVVRGELGANRTGRLPPPRWNDTQAQRDERQNAKYRDFLASTQSADVHVPGGDNVFTTTPPDRTGNSRMARILRAQEEVGVLHPWVGAGGPARDRAMDEFYKNLNKEESELAKQGVIGDKARDVADIGYERALDVQKEKSRDAKEARQNKLRIEMAKATLQQTIAADKNNANLMREAIRSVPNGLNDPIGLKNKLSPFMKNITPEQALDVAKMLSGINPHTDEMATGGLNTMRPDSTEAAARYNLTPGQAVPVNIKGRQVMYYVGPDGNGYPKEEYDRLFGSNRAGR